jgi:hypothetical protein
MDFRQQRRLSAIAPTERLAKNALGIGSTPRHSVDRMPIHRISHAVAVRNRDGVGQSDGPSTR